MIIKMMTKKKRILVFVDKADSTIGQLHKAMLQTGDAHKYDIRLIRKREDALGFHFDGSFDVFYDDTASYSEGVKYELDRLLMEAELLKSHMLEKQTSNKFKNLI